MRYNRGLKRRKAPFGTVEAATLAAAGIQAATTIATSAMEMKAAKENAKQAADIAVSNADKEVAALRKQNENANELQAKNQEFISAQNEENRDIQKTIQMNLQMMAAKQNEADRLATTRMQVRNGGSSLLRGTRKRAKALSGSQVVTSPYNLDFSVTDGGFVTPIGQSFTGDLYEIRGNDHNHYHKTKGGKRKTGVGIKFENGEIIEGEGNQNTNQGELLLVTPNDAKFISRHTLKGFNPALAVLSGMAPEQAFNIQENIKYNYNIPDDGKKAENGKAIKTKTPIENLRGEDALGYYNYAIGNRYIPDNFAVDKEVMDFFRNYANSKGYERISKNLNKEAVLTDWLFQNPNSSKLNILSRLSNPSFLDPSTYESNSKTLTKVNPKGFGDLGRLSIVGTKPSSKSNNYPIDFIRGHERFHVNDGADNMWRSKYKLLDENYIVPKENNPNYEHDSKYNEREADINGLKFLLHKSGIYDVTGEKDMNLEQAKRLREAYPDLRPLQYMNDDQVVKLINTITYNNVNKTNRRKANAGYQVVNDLFTANDMIIPDMSQDTTGAIAGSAMRSKLKCGGRRKAPNGYYKYLIDTENPDLTANQLTPDLGYNRLGAVSLNSKPIVDDRNFRNPTSTSPDTDLTPDTGFRIPTADTDLAPSAPLAEPKTRDRYGLTNTQAQLLGAGITGVGNAVGSILTIAGNRAANRIRNTGINSATDLALAGYDQLHGIDYSSINQDNYKAAHEMPAIRLARYNVEPQLTGVSRSLERQRSAIANNTMSGAAAINRLNRAETNAYDMRSKLYGVKDNQEEAIKQKNIDIINKAVANNASRDMQSNLYRTRDLLDLAKYNNNIDNTKIALKTKAKTDRTLSIANNNALTRQTNMGVAANAFSSTAQGFANTLGELGKQRAELDYNLLGSDMKTTMELLDKYANGSDPVKRRYALRMRKQIGFTNRI